MSDVRILAVDDQPANLLSLEAVLRPLGHVVVCARSGADALRELMTQDFAVILLDARMPDMDGYETAALVRQRKRSAHTPIIFLTADIGDSQDILRAYDEGAVDFIGKPFEPKILRAKVAIFISLYEQRMQLVRQAAALLEKERAAAEAEAAFQTTELQRALEAAHVLRLVEERRVAEVYAVKLAQISAELVRSNSELEQVAYGASHDLKAPLRGISAVCGWLEEDFADVMNDDARKHFAQLRTRVRRMTNLIDGILAFAQVGQARARPETVDLNQLLQGLIEMLPVPEGATLRIAPGLPAARIQRHLLERVFANLLSNAFKYARRSDAHVEVGCSETGPFLEFWVSDNGPGIDAQYHDRIWNLFQRLESQEEVEGTGVGLALVKKIVDGQGGRVWVESTLGLGSSFHFLWPREPLLHS